MIIANLLTLRGVLADGSVVSASATLTGAKQTQKLVGINGYEVEVPLASHHIVMMYEDRPGNRGGRMGKPLVMPPSILLACRLPGTPEAGRP